MNRQSLDNNPNYHHITSSEIKAFNKYLPNVRKALDLTKKHFIGKMKTYVYVINNRDVQALSVLFQRKHFMHLCGVEYPTGANGFVSDLQRKKLKLQNLYIKEDGSTFQKLEVIDQIALLDTLDTKVSIGNKRVNIQYDNLLRTKANILGIAVKADNNGINFPLSLLNLSVAETFTSFKVVAILEENTSTHVKTCLQIEKDCTEKVKKEIDKLLDINFRTTSNQAPTKYTNPT